MRLNFPIYMDYHATTPVDPRVVDVMLPYLTREFGNPSSRHHAYGWHAQKAVEDSRASVARLLGCETDEIIFTSGCTEGNNLALKGVAEVYRQKGRHIVTQVTEHKSVLDTCRYLETQGFKVTYLPVDSHGLVSPAALEEAIGDGTILVSIMFANNEVGTIQPMAEIGRIAKRKSVFFHVDGAQAAGKIPVDVKALGIDLFSFSSHKMYGPKGVGALYVRKENPYVRLAPLLHGGGHEQGLRSGTLNVPAIVGFAKACDLASEEMDEEARRVSALRDRLQDGLQDALEGLAVHGHPAHRLPNNLNVSFDDVDGESLLEALNEKMAVSSGSACITARSEASYVLKALGVPAEQIHTSVRFGLGRFNTVEEVDFAVERTAHLVKQLRALSPWKKRGTEKCQ